MRLTDIGDLARDLAALAPAMRSNIEPLARHSRAAARGVGELNDELEDNSHGSKRAKAALKTLTDTMLSTMRTSVAWNDELQKQLRGGMSAASRNISTYKERTLALEKEAKAIQALSGTSKEGAAAISSGMDAAYQSLSKNLLSSSELIGNVSSGMFTGLLKDASRVRNQMEQEATKVRNAALVSQRISGMSDGSTAAIFKTAMADLQLGTQDTAKLFDSIAMASRDFGLNGDKSFAVLTDNLEDIRRQDVKDREAYIRRLLTTAGMMERASFDFKKYAGGLMAREGVHGMQDVAMASAVLGVDQTNLFNLQARSKANDVDASKQLSRLVEGMLRNQAPGFSLEQYRKNQSGDLQMGSQADMNKFYESQELATQWLKLIGMDTAGLANMKDMASRTDGLRLASKNTESAIGGHITSDKAMEEFMASTRTAGETVNQYGARIAQFFDGMTERIAKMGQAIGLGTTESGMKDSMRMLEGAGGYAATGLAAGGSLFTLSKLAKVGGLGRLLPSLMGAGGAAAGGATAVGATTAAAVPAAGLTGAALAKVVGSRLGLAGYAIGGIATALESDQQKDQDIKDAQQQSMLRRSLSGVMNPLGQVVLLQRSLSQASDSAAALREADTRFLDAQRLEMEVKQTMKEVAIKQQIKQRGISPGKGEDGKSQSGSPDTSQARSETLLERIVSGIEKTNSLMMEYLSASQLGPVVT